MKKIVKKIFLLAVIFLVVILIAVFLFAKSVYRAIKDRGGDFPPFINSLIDKMRPEEAIKIIPAEEKNLKILEGWTLRDIASAFEKQSLSSSEEFYAVSGEPQTDYRRATQDTWPQDFSEEFSFLTDKPKHYGLEGYLFPDTYRVFASSTPVDVIRRLLTNFDKKLTSQMRADIAAQGRTIYEVITLASLIEKEAPINYRTGDNQDAKLVAGVFMNRLAIGQGLQADATLSYIFNDNKPAHSGAELQVDSPYNTYKYRGLPPGPICNPGILAIEAAIYPAKHNYYYFLTPNDKREVIYAKTYEEHLFNKRKYLK